MDEAQKLNALEEGQQARGKVFEQAAQPSLLEQAQRAPPRVKLFALLGAVALLLYTARSYFFSLEATPYTLVLPRYLGRGGRWPGYKNLEHLVIFGDSYSETAFNPDGPQPSYEDPLGNPPEHGSWTSSNGPNWAIFMPTIYNSSFLKAVNFAAGGATMDQDLIPQYHKDVRSMKKQVVEVLVPKYNFFTSPAAFKWGAENTLFIIWIGINDIHNSFSWENKDAVQRQDLELYAFLVDKMYEVGARNFLFMNVPPTDLSPLTMHEGPEVQAAERADILRWNKAILEIARGIYNRYGDVSSFVFDTHALFTEIIRNPCSHAETCEYKETAEWCPGYKDGTPTWYSKFDACPYSIDQYFWKDALHPTFRVHNATAKMVSKFLAAI